MDLHVGALPRQEKKASLWRRSVKSPLLRNGVDDPLIVPVVCRNAHRDRLWAPLVVLGGRAAERHPTRSPGPFAGRGFPSAVTQLLPQRVILGLFLCKRLISLEPREGIEPPMADYKAARYSIPYLLRTSLLFFFQWLNLAKPRRHVPFHTGFFYPLPTFFLARLHRNYTDSVGARLGVRRAAPGRSPLLAGIRAGAVTRDSCPGSRAPATYSRDRPAKGARTG